MTTLPGASKWEAYADMYDYIYATWPAASFTSNPVQLRFNTDRIFKIQFLGPILLLFPNAGRGPVDSTPVWLSQGKKGWIRNKAESKKLYKK